MEFVHQAIGLIATHKTWAALLVGAFALGESVVVLGIFVPGTAVLVLVGGLIGTGVLDPWPVMLGAATGGGIGFAISYLIGARLGRGALSRWPFDRYREAAARARLFLRRYGFVAVFVGRFFGPAQGIVPLVAGALGMSARRFQVANVLSAIAWAPLILSPGWLIARSWRRIIVLTDVHWFRPAALIILGVAVVGLIGLRLYLRGRNRNGAVVPPGIGA